MFILAAFTVAGGVWFGIRATAPRVAQVTPADDAKRRASPAGTDGLAKTGAQATLEFPLLKALDVTKSPVRPTRCGPEDQPQLPSGDADPESNAPNEAKPAGSGFVAATQRIDVALRTSGDPYARAVADWLDVGGSHSPGERADALMKAATVTRDPRIYALAYRSCTAVPPPTASCQLLNARQWARLDDGNAVPWGYVLDDARKRGDVSGQQEALFHIASSTRFEDRPFDAPAVISEQLPNDPESLAANSALTMQAFHRSMGQFMTTRALFDTCRDQAGGDANRVQLCAAVANLMFDHSDTLLLRSLGGSLHLQITGDSLKRDKARAEMAQLAARWTPPAGNSECGQIREMMKDIQHKAEVGEIVAARESLLSKKE